MRALLLGCGLLLHLGTTVHAASMASGRVVSLAPSLTELVFALGAGHSLVGVTSVCDYPDAALAIPRVGGMVDGEIDLERILALRPDLVLAIGEGQASTAESLQRLGLRVEVVPSQTLDDVFRAAERIGALLGENAAATRFNAALRRRVDHVRELVGPLPASRRPRVFYEVWDLPLMTATRNTLIGQLIELAGGINVFGDLGGRYVQISPEAVLKNDPQVILAPQFHGQRVEVSALMRRPGLAGVEAVRNGRVVVLDGDVISRVGPRVAQALELVAHALHPELFP